MSLSPPQGDTVEDDDDFDDDDEYENYHTGEESGVQLGTVRPLEGSLAETVLFKDADWHEWDGGKAGGWPVRQSGSRPLLLETLCTAHCIKSTFLARLAPPETRRTSEKPWFGDIFAHTPWQA